MPANAHDLQHDIALLERAIAIASETWADGLLSAAEDAAIGEDIANLADAIVGLASRLDLA